MKITKYAHSCLLIEVDGVNILTDLGSWNPTVPEIPELHALVITHEHGDHFDMEKVQALRATHPDMQIITHPAVGEKLAGAGITYTAIEAGGRVEVAGVAVESYGTEHAIIYGAASPCRNTGFLIAEKLFIPGDALHDVPAKPVEILALPTGGPWMKIAEAIDYAKAVKPKKVFPIHDAMHTEAYRSMMPRLIGAQLEADGIVFVNMEDGSSEEF